MAEFKSSLIVQDDFGLPYILYVPLVFESDVLKKDIIVPVGFTTDLASIPFYLWSILPKSSRYDRAAVIHDYLYVKNGCTREEADNVLREAMGVLEVGSVRKWMIFRGVRLGGWKPWGKYREAEK